MKNFLILFSVVLIAFLIRIYNFENRITYGPEQARSLMVSAKYIKEKPSLLGQEYFRVNSQGHKLFTAATFNYSLIPLLLVFNYEIVPITFYFAILNIIAGVIVYNLTKKMFGKRVALLSIVLFLFNNYMIYHSMFIWVLNYLPLIGILSLYLVWKINKKKNSLLDVLFLGILSGVGFGMEYLYILAILIILFFIIKYTTNKFLNIFIFGVGGVMGDFTQVIFDLKHDFYHLRTLWQYVLDTFNGVSDAGFVYYHFLQFWPVVIIFASVFLAKIYKTNKLLAVSVVVIYIFVNLNSQLIDFSKPVGMPDGLNYASIDNAAKVVAKKSGDSFNVVTLYDFDTRGYVLRYLVEYKYGKKPMGEVDYPNANQIFALAKSDYNFENDNPWELNVIKPYNVNKLSDVGSGFSVFQLSK